MKNFGIMSLVALLTLIGSNVFASTDGEQKIINYKTIMYPGSNVDTYLRLENLLLSEQVRSECPDGVSKISKISVSVDAEFEVNKFKSVAKTYPNITLHAVIECK